MFDSKTILIAVVVFLTVGTVTDFLVSAYFDYNSFPPASFFVTAVVVLVYMAWNP